MYCWAEAHIKIARMTLTIKLDGNWSSFQLANSAPPLSVTDSAIAPSARMAVFTGRGNACFNHGGAGPRGGAFVRAWIGACMRSSDDMLRCVNARRCVDACMIGLFRRCVDACMIGLLAS